MTTRTVLLAGSLAGLLAIAAPASAQSDYANGLLNDRFFISVGGFLVGTDLKAELNGRAGRDQQIDFGSDFDLDNDATRVRIDGLWRITPTHRLRFLYFDTRNTQARTLDRDLVWGDYTFNVGARVDAQIEASIAELAYEYAFVRRPTYEVAATIGVHYIDTTVKLSGSATFTDANGNVTTARSTTLENSAPAPLPVIGLRAGWVVSPQWYLDAQAQYFKAKVGDYDGTITEARVAATWMFHRSVGVGVGYSLFRTDVDVDRTSFNGNLKVGYSGLQLFVTGTF